MRSLINFVVKYHFQLLFLLFQIIAIGLLVQTNAFHKSSFINSSNSVIGSIYEQKEELYDYFSLREQYEELAEENALYRSRDTNYFRYVISPGYSVQDSVHMQRYTYIAAKVINSFSNKRNNYITLNKGTEDGVGKDMGVICPNGIVGFVEDASDHFSVVVPIINNKFKIKGMLANNGYGGIIHWQGLNNDKVLLQDISRHVEVAEGDKIITKGVSAYFPEGLPIGTIAKIESDRNDNFHTLDVELATDFDNLNNVYVIQDILKIEQQKIESEALEDDAN